MSEVTGIAPPEQHILGNSDDLGLLISIDSETDNGKGFCLLTLCQDQNYPSIHPNVYAPANLDEVRVLAGGGSGAAVFGGTHSDLGHIVMKHGGEKETKELFALSTIARELDKRGATAEYAAKDLSDRLPEYRMVYISPNHLIEKDPELWCHLKSLLRAFQPSDLDSSHHLAAPVNVPPSNRRPQNGARLIRVSTHKYEKAVTTQLRKGTFDLSLREDAVVMNGMSCRFQSEDCAYDSLKILVDQLGLLQREHLWKFTLGQKRIGGPSPRTASSILAAGELRGELLDFLINEFIEVISGLQAVTLPEEANVIQQIKRELTYIETHQNVTAADVSKVTDAFCGHSIKKNWDPQRGRFCRLGEMGEQFRSNSLILTRAEELPARHLGVLLQRGSRLGDVYDDASIEDTKLDFDMQTWRTLLEHAVMGVRSPAALRRIWTCGLSDAGLHNLFLSSEQLWLFDLGEPSLQSLPGFLTKFLFSFFHTLGMEEDGKGSWVKRFIPGEKLALTKETELLLPKAYEAFEEALDRLSDEFFFGEDGVRELLIQYVTLQLLSDSAFCLERWVLKGGGRSRQTNHQVGIEKWLWRALWDIYVAFDINTKEWSCEPYRSNYSVFRRSESMRSIDSS